MDATEELIRRVVAETLSQASSARPKRFFSLEEAADYLGLKNPGYVRQLVRDSKLVGYKQGKYTVFAKAALDSYADTLETA